MPPKRPAIRLRLRNLLGQRSRYQQTHQQAWPKMWVSTNKVLIGSVGGMKKPHCRNPNFDCEETKLLISLWGDPQVQRTLITTHKKHPVIAKLAEKMREYGYNRSTEEINTRIKNLKCFYNRIKKDLETGVINEPSWKHFQAMDDILTRPVFGGANAPSRYPPTSSGSAAGGSAEGAGGGTSSGRLGRPRLSGGSVSGAELSELDPDQIEVKLELVSDDEKELHPEDLLKNAEQVELKEPNLLIPKDEPMEEDEDDPNDPDFEDDGGSETDDESSGMDEADESDRSTRLRRRTRRSHKPKRTTLTPGGKAATTTAPPSTTTSTSTVTSAPSQATPVPGTIKIIKYAGGGSISLSSVANVVSAVPSASSTVSVATLAGKSDTTTTVTTTATTTPSKISLVPTNFLLKPQASNLTGFKQPIQLYTKPTVSIATTKQAPGLSPIVSVNTSAASAAGGGGAATTTTPSTAAGAAPMKVFLVNTLSKDGSGPKQQLITPSTAKQIYTTSTGVSLQGTSHVSGLPQISIQPKQLLTSGTTTTTGTTIGRKIFPGTNISPLRPTLSASAAPPKMGGFKALLQQLVGLQRENLGITKTRLVAEKERFGNEKSVANSLLDALGELNALLTEVNGEMVPMGKESDDDEEDGLIKISSDSPVSSPRRSVSRQDESVKPEVISDSEES